MARLNSAPGDIMSFLQACAMGNLARVEELLEKGVVGILFSIIKKLNCQF